MRLRARGLPRRPGQRRLPLRRLRRRHRALVGASIATQDLEHFVRDYTPSVALIERLKNPGFADSVRVILNWARALQGRTAAPLSLSGRDASTRPTTCAAIATTRSSPASMRRCAAACRVLLGTPAAGAAGRAAFGGADRTTCRARSGRCCTTSGTRWRWPRSDRAARTDAGAAPALDGAARGPARRSRSARRTAPRTSGAQALLLAAEIARVEGRLRDAIELASRPIEFAAPRPLLPLEALAHEIAVRLRLRHGQPRLADAAPGAGARALRRAGAQRPRCRRLEREYGALAHRPRRGAEHGAGRRRSSPLRRRRAAPRRRRRARPGQRAEGHAGDRRRSRTSTPCSRG